MVGWPDRRFLDLVGCEQPIIQAPMAGAGGVELCVSHGGWGAWLTALRDAQSQQVREQVGKSARGRMGR